MSATNTSTTRLILQFYQFLLHNMLHYSTIVCCLPETTLKTVIVWMPLFQCVLTHQNNPQNKQHQKTILETKSVSTEKSDFRLRKLQFCSKKLKTSQRKTLAGYSRSEAMEVVKSAPPSPSSYTKNVHR